MKAISRRGFLVGAAAVPLAVAMSGLEAVASVPMAGAIRLDNRAPIKGRNTANSIDWIPVTMPGGVTRYVPVWQ